MKIAFPVSPTVIVGDRAPVRLPMFLCYEPNRDPYAVAITPAPGNRELEWLLGRELLRSGLSAMAGEGAMCVVPGPGLVGVGFRCSCCRQAVLLFFTRREVSRFVETVFRVVPEGSEADRLDWSDVSEVLS